MSRDKRGLRDIEAHVAQALAQLFLAVHGLPLDDLADGGQPARFHIYAFD